MVDYKSTSKDGEVSLDDQWKESYKRQMDIYQWLLRGNGFTVQPRGYFVYANGRTDLAAFDAKLEFNLTLLGYDGDDGWVAPALARAHDCLMFESLPSSAEGCEYCIYRRDARGLEVGA